MRFIKVSFRLLVEWGLNLLGLFNIFPLWASPKNGKMKVVFQTYSPHLAELYQTIIEALKARSDQFEIHFSILPHPHFSLKSTLELATYLEKRYQIPRSNIRFFWQDVWNAFDILICTDVYARFPLRVQKKYLLKHGPGVNLRSIKAYLWRKSVFDFDVTFLNGELDYLMIKSACGRKIEKANLEILGYPFTDLLFEKSNENEYPISFGTQSDKLTILFAPSWSGLKLMKNYGADYFEQMISLLKKMDVNIIVKLHACSFNKMMSGMDWKRKLETIPAMPNLRIDYNIDDIPAMKYSDVLITDISSRAFSFMLLDKPVIYHYAGERYRDEQDQNRFNLIRSALLVANQIDDIATILTDLTNKKIKLQDNRKIKDLCFANPGKATQVFMDYLKNDQLQIEN